MGPAAADGAGVGARAHPGSGVAWASRGWRCSRKKAIGTCKRVARAASEGLHNPTEVGERWSEQRGVGGSERAAGAAGAVHLPPSSRRPKEVLHDGGSPQRGGPTAVPPRGIKPRTLTAGMPTGRLSQRVIMSRRCTKRGCLDTLRESQKTQSRRKCETCARAQRVRVGCAVGGMCEGVCSAGFGPRGHACSRPACETCSEPAQTPKHVFVRGGFLLHFIVFHLTACDVNMTYAAGSAGMARAGAVV